MEIIETAFDKEVMLLQQMKATVDDTTIISDWKGNWTTGTVYKRRDMVIDTASNNLYICLTAHTAGTFATDLSNGLWSLIFDASTLSAVPVAGTVLNEAALGTGTQDGQFVICTANGNMYTWDLANSKWRIQSGNLYTSNPSTATYTVETGTFVRVNSLIKLFNGTAWITVSNPGMLGKRKLEVYTTSSSALTVKAEELMLKNSSTGEFNYVESVNKTCSITSSGAGGLDTGSESSATMYYVWVISDGTNVNTLLSLSDTAPTMPSGYIYKRLVSEIFNDASGNFIRFYRDNDKVNFEQPQPVYTNQTLTTTFLSFNLPVNIPSGASEISFEATNTTAYPVSQIIRPDNTSRFELAISNGATVGANAGPTAGYGSVHVTLKHLGATTIYARSDEGANRANQSLHAWGYKKEL